MLVLNLFIYQITHLPILSVSSLSERTSHHSCFLKDFIPMRKLMRASTSEHHPAFSYLCFLPILKTSTSPTIQVIITMMRLKWRVRTDVLLQVVHVRSSTDCTTA